MTLLGYWRVMDALTFVSLLVRNNQDSHLYCSSLEWGKVYWKYMPGWTPPFQCVCKVHNLDTWYNFVMRKDFMAKPSPHNHRGERMFGWVTQCQTSFLSLDDHETLIQLPFMLSGFQWTSPYDHDDEWSPPNFHHWPRHQVLINSFGFMWGVILKAMLNVQSITYLLC